MLNKNKKLSVFLCQIADLKIITFASQDIAALPSLGKIKILHVNAQDFGAVFKVASCFRFRFVGLWAQDLNEHLQVDACLFCDGDYFLVRAKVSANDPKITAVSPYYPAANRLERHQHDMLGLIFIDSADQRRWTRHKAWPENYFPLRKNSASILPQDAVLQGDFDYPFSSLFCDGVCEIPVGPVHAGIIEPGHFRFQIAGEDILVLEERLGYVHKGIEKIAEGRNIDGLIKLAGRVSCDSTVAHALCAAFAFENAYGLLVSERAVFLRAIMAERERVANHLGDFAAICNDVGFSFAYYQFMRLKELWLRLNAKVFGHRLMMDRIVAGGVSVDLKTEDKDKIAKQVESTRKELDELYLMLEENSSLHDRLKTTGILSQKIAESFGALGFLGRASGIDFDLRRDAPYAPYDKLKIEVPIYKHGDVLARLRLRAKEILVSLCLIEQFLQALPEGEIKLFLPSKMQEAEGIGLVEGWRGEILVYVSFDSEGLVKRYFPRDPSWFSWPCLEQLVHGNIVPDFPVCNKSVNGSYAGVDL